MFSLKEVVHKSEVGVAASAIYLSFGEGPPTPSGRPARRAISSVVERAPDNCVVVPGL